MQGVAERAVVDQCIADVDDAGGEDVECVIVCFRFGPITEFACRALFLYGVAAARVVDGAVFIGLADAPAETGFSAG